MEKTGINESEQLRLKKIIKDIKDKYLIEETIKNLETKLLDKGGKTLEDGANIEVFLDDWDNDTFIIIARVDGIDHKFEYQRNMV